MKDQAGTLLQLVSRFRLSPDVASPTLLEPLMAVESHPAPIRTHARAELPPAYVAAIKNATSHNEEWKEF